MRSFKTEGIIIKRRNIGEADRLLTVLTKHHGKIQIKALGVRKIISRRSPHIELLNHSLLTVHKGRVAPILTEAQTLHTHTEIKDDLTKIGFAYHFCELLDGLCAENQEHESVFHLFKKSLVELSSQNNLAEVVHNFEIELLTLLGFFPVTQNQNIDTTSYIEDILERRLKTKSLLSHFS